MNLEDITDAQRNTRKMRLAAKRKGTDIGKTARDLTKQKVDTRDNGQYNSGVDISNDDSVSPDLSTEAQGDV